MASMIRTVFFTLFFRKIGTENVGFFFSIYENRALNTGSNLLRSSSAKDTMLCARACATQINCQTAIFHFDENKCELYEKRTEDILKTMVKSEGHHLITKVKMVHSPGVIQDPTIPSPVFSWLHFTPQWCSLAGRSGERLATGTTADECKELCKGNCLGVEWWEGSKSCFECTDPSKKVVYTNTNDNGYPPHVFLKSQNS